MSVLMLMIIKKFEVNRHIKMTIFSDIYLCTLCLLKMENKKKKKSFGFKTFGGMKKFDGMKSYGGLKKFGGMKRSRVKKFKGLKEFNGMTPFEGMRLFQSSMKLFEVYKAGICKSVRGCFV